LAANVIRGKDGDGCGELDAHMMHALSVMISKSDLFSIDEVNKYLKQFRRRKKE
jgi:hypothetical protein